MIFTDKKYLLHVILFFIIFGLSSDYYFNSIPKGDLLPNTCFDGFGLGALLAWVLIFKNDFKQKFYKLAFVFGILASFIFLVLILWLKMPINIPGRFLTFIISIWILSYVVINAENKTLKFRFILHNPILLFIGKISYGMYLYHFIIPSLLNTNLINKYINPNLPDFLFKNNFKWLFFFENFFLLILFSWLSYNFIEKRFLRLKRYY